uniref:Uncharacterized protein LOC105640858 isoform X1 n=1 Tax=Rhizophora mucronata TaxID=61149 RepID=A0A2P2J5F1_RHIMU
MIRPISGSVLWNLAGKNCSIMFMLKSIITISIMTPQKPHCNMPIKAILQRHVFLKSCNLRFFFHLLIFFFFFFYNFDCPFRRISHQVPAMYGNLFKRLINTRGTLLKPLSI